MQHAGPIAVAVVLMALTASCSGHSSAAGAKPPGSPAGQVVLGTDCGMSVTAAQVPVIIEVPHGAVGCAEALRIQRNYAAKLRAGQAPGNGGGGPVPVDGWICQGYPTPQVLQTGRASECHRGAVTFYAVLPPPNASATP